MIPLKLQIKNFLSYGPELQTIDFSPYHLICLSGKNGHGKSALLDAITWTIWGQARKVSGAIKPDQNLLRLGQTQMMVILDFLFGDSHYRIRREYMQTYGKPLLNLEFGMIDPDTQQIIPLTDKTIRTTQAKIEQTLHLDFDSFTNSAFLRQGNANEFSKKSPKDRKEILAAILGLNQYDTIRRLAMDRAKQAITKKQTIKAFQEKIEQELQQKKELEQHIAAIKQNITQLENQEKQLEKEQKTLEKKQRNLTEKQKQYALIIFQIKKLDEQTTNQQPELQQLLTTWRIVHKKQLTLPDQKELENNKKRLVETINQHQQKLQHSLEVKEKYLQIKEQLHGQEKKHQEQHAQTIQRKKIELERFVMEHKNIITTLETLKHQEKTDATTLEKLITNNKIDTGKRAQVPMLEEQFEKRKAYYQQFIAQGNWLKTELEQLEQKNKLVQEDNPSCPLCEQNLSQARRKFLKNKFAKTNRLLHHQLIRLSTVIKKLKQILIEQHNYIKTVKQIIEQQKELHAKIGTNQEQQKTAGKQLQEISVHIAAQEKAVQHAEKQMHEALHNDPEYKTLAKQLEQLEKEAKKTEYNIQEHQESQRKLQQLEQQLTEYAHLQQEITMQAQRKKEIAQLCAKLKNIKQEKKEFNEHAKTYSALKDEQTAVAKQGNELLGNRKTLHQEKETILQEKGSLLTKHEKLTQLEKEQKEQAKTICLLNETIEDYQTIATATGKDGIQALLIEEIIPEIEQEANQLLAKLTNNQAQIFIESLRDLKKGGTKETLDINISDPTGIRPYELFSGGEAFRIDFALRIAISKLLARRAGTALQTLIIDEGFGSQDEEGLSHIMDAIYKIQDDFSKVIIVSHLSALKDQFPVHFFIEKGPQGSRVQVIEQG